MLTCSVVLLALFASVQGRAVNISNTWVLPEEGFPVFYRYFRDRISWYEADAVCQFHHANLVTVDTTAQYDAVRAYLKELDISSAVWVGLIRSNPDGDFTWTDYRGLSGDGYWSAAPDARAAPLCAAADPAADYRWEARACGGPTVASFICELPVPQWALGNEGCMVRALPALTVLYLPESAAVQLTADCGLAGVKRVQCTGDVKHEDLLRDLSCSDEDEISSTPSVTSVGTTWSITTDTTFTDQDTSTEVTTEESATTHEDNVNQPTLIKATPTPYNLQVEQTKLPAKQPLNIIRLNNGYLQKTINLDLIHNNNLQSNDIPKIANTKNFLTLEQSEKLEDEKHMHDKILHDELARHGNFETIFSQPTDHFVPPLVMAKAKISDDMTVLSLAEKHAQQLAEQRFVKHYVHEGHSDHVPVATGVPKSTTEVPKNVDTTSKTLEVTMQSINDKDSLKKDIIKSSVPKKYKQKLDDPKGRNLKIDNKLAKIEKSNGLSFTSTESLGKEINTTTTKVTKMYETQFDNDSTIDLSVILKEPDLEENGKTVHTKYSDDMPKLDTIRNNMSIKEPVSILKQVENVTSGINHETSVETYTETMIGVTLNHEIINITIINEKGDNTSPTSTMYEITTRMPKFKDNAHRSSSTATGQIIEETTKSNIVTINPSNNETVHNITLVTEKEGLANSSSVSDMVTVVTETVTLNSKDESHQGKNIFTTKETLTTGTEDSTSNTTSARTHINDDVQKDNAEVSTTAPNIIDVTTEFKIDVFNHTDIHEDDDMNERNSTDTSETIDDFQSPLLSAANEPLHRPNRSRRPQPPNRLNKFNPFRILG